MVEISVKKALNFQGFFIDFFFTLQVLKYVNMKRLSIVLAFFSFLPLLRAQQTVPSNLPLDPDTKKIMYRAVVDQEGTPAYLYDKAVLWFSYYYPNPTAIYTIQDKVNGKIEGTGRMKIYYHDEKSDVTREGGLIIYNLKLEFKDNKFRYTITDFNLKTASRFPIEKWMNSGDPAHNPNWDLYLYQVDTTMQRLVATLKEKMKPTVIKKDEW